MTDTVHRDLLTPSVEAEDDEQVTALTSRQQQLRKKFEGRAPEKLLYKRFPARDGSLVAEYGLVSVEAVNTSARSISDDALVANNSAILIDAIQRIMCEDPEHPLANERGLVDLEKWLEIDAGGPFKFDHRLCRELGQPEGTASEILLGLFEGNGVALCNQADDLIAWTVNTTAEHLQDFGVTS